MFKKVLVVEDFDSINETLVQSLAKMGIKKVVETSKYCDDALLRLKVAAQENQPFDLLITDLSFIEDHREVTLKSGIELIEKVREENLDIKIIVYSIENKSFKIRELFNKYKINGYVAKSRKSLEYLKTAVETISYTDGNYMSPEISLQMYDHKNINEINSYDIDLLRYLSNGISQDEIERLLKERGVMPNSKSSVEKRIAKLKDYFKANNILHLITIAKDLGII